jgi:hypothetical protein
MFESCVDPAAPRGTGHVVRWILFLPGGIVCGLVASTIIYYVGYFILRLALFFVPGWFAEGLATFVNGWCFGGMTVWAAGVIAPNHRKIVATCVAAGMIFVGGGIFILGVHSGNVMMWLVGVAQALGTGVGVLFFWSEERDIWR